MITCGEGHRDPSPLLRPASLLVAEGEPGRSGIVRVERGPGGEVLNIGRKSRSLPPALRRALEVRDRGCRSPGCVLRFTDGHPPPMIASTAASAGSSLAK